MCFKQNKRFKSKCIQHDYGNQWIKNANADVNVKNVVQIKYGIMINADAVVKTIVYLKDYIWNSVTCSYKNENNLASIIDDSVITCNKIIDAKKTKTVTANFN